MRKVFNGTKNGERIDGTGKADRIFGDDGNDKLVGHPGDDTIDGGRGDDVIFGGQDFDTLKGAKGADRFAFNSLQPVDGDLILDFRPGQDRVVFDHHVFDEYRRPGRIEADDFVLGTAALDDDDHFIYDQATGSLYYDEDGSGAGGQVLVATLDNKADLTASDVFIF